MVKAIVGANWGDEGKGKITDLLAETLGYCRSFPGRCQRRAIPSSMTTASLPCICCPSGVFYPHTMNIIGNGVALDIPQAAGRAGKLLTDGGVPAPQLIDLATGHSC